MDSHKGFAPIIIVVIIAAMITGGGVLYYQIRKQTFQTQSQRFYQPQTKVEVKEVKTETALEETPKEKPKKESVAKQEIKPEPATLPSSSKINSSAKMPPPAEDPWNDPIVSAPINLVLPLAVADIEEAETVLSPYGIIRKSGDGGIGHGGIDFPLRKNGPLYAVASGTIIKNNLEDPGGGKTVDILIMPGKFQGDGWIFKYDHVNITPGLKVGDYVEKGQQIGTNAFVERGNNHIGLEYQIKNFTIAREKICWVDRLKPIAKQQLENKFNQIKKTPAFIQYWQTANEEGYYQYKSLLDEIKYPNGPQLCYPLGTDARIPVSANSGAKKEIYGDRNPFYQKDGVSFEYYWPVDPIAPGLSAEETEILVHNESGKAVEISFVEIEFNLNGKNYIAPPGSWEKFVSRLSWNRIEYRIFPRGAVNPPFALSSGQKGKLHYHFSFSENPTSDKPQSVKVKINFSVGGVSYILDQIVNRPPL